jgi:glutamyl-tRNA reductase
MGFGLDTYVAVGLNHRTAPVALREHFAVSPAALSGTLRAMREREGVREAVLLSTCNRVEWYLAVSGEGAGTDAAVGWFLARGPEGGEEVRSAVRTLRGEEVVRHLFRVASGLESMAVGEPQILGQVRDAFAAGQGAGTVGPALDALFRAALACGRRVRREAGVEKWASSVPVAAVAHAVRVVERPPECRVLLVGAGKMSEVAARALRQVGVGRMCVANRTRAAAESLAARVGADVVEWEDVDRELRSADVVLVSTGAPHVVLRADRVARAVAGRRAPLVLIDIAVPRNVDPEAGRLPGVHLFDIDALARETSPEGMGAELRKAEALVEAEVGQFRRERAARRVASVIATACADAEAIAEEEWARARSRLGRLSSRDEAVIRGVLHRVVRKVLHRPIAALVEASAEGGEA